MNRVVPDFKSINKKVIDNILDEREKSENSNNSTSKEKIIIKIMSRRNERNFSDLARKY